MTEHTTETTHIPANLAWGTYKENTADAIAHGQFGPAGRVGPRGEKCATSKLTWPEVDEIRRLALLGHTGAALAKRYGVTKATTCAIIRGATWIRDEAAA